MADEGRLRLNEDGRLIDESGLPTTVIDLDGNDPPASAFGDWAARRQSLSRRACALVLLLVVATLLGPAQAPTTSGSQGARPRAVTSSRPIGSATFRDPSSGSIVIEYSPSA